MKGHDSQLQKLLDEQSDFQKRLKAAKQDIVKRENLLHKQRALVVGLAVLSELEDNRQLGATLTPVIEARVTSPKERKLLGLKPITKSKIAKKNEPAIAGKNEKD